MTVYEIRCRIDITIPVDGELSDGSLARAQIAAMEALQASIEAIGASLPEKSLVQASPAQLVRVRGG